MTIANTTNSQGKCHVFHTGNGQDEEADQGKDDVSMVIKITQMTIKMKMNQYKDDIHQDEDDEYQHKDE